MQFIYYNMSRSPLQIQLYLKIGVESTSNKRTVLNWQSSLLTRRTGNHKHVLDVKTSVHVFAVVCSLNTFRVI